MTDIFDYAYKALKLTENAGADEAEIFCIKGRSVTVDVQRDAIDLAKESLVLGIGIRAIVNGAVGFSSTNDMERIEEACVLAVKSAKVRGSDPQWSGLPGKKKPAEVTGIFDKKLENIEIESCIDYTLEMIRGAKSSPRVVPTSGHFVCGSSTKLVLNSHGVEITEDDTIVEASVDTITKDAPMSTASEFDMSRNLGIDFHKIGEKASLLALRSQHGISAQTCDCAVLLEPLAFADILENTLVASLNADNVQKGRSALIGKMNTIIGANDLSIVDDGTLAGGLGTSSCDDEGTPSRRTAVVKNGELSSFLYDCYAAGKEKKESTGNAVRASFTSTPSIGTRNLIIEHPVFDIIDETKDGVIVNTVIGAHTANPISGDFSVEARNSFLIKNGEISSPIKSMMISGNIFDVLKNIDGMGKDTRKVGNVITPTVRVSKMRIVG
ncbi:MAG: TldD/PmbA family protein [Candidatus Methanoperedens sp.]|nr:TldD/PmbA family protein [Candidatus Methanoperedens sp.]MCZ7396687.1 TldD/PmbA family protein [Candidatus Methanoperedens sp.]